MEELLKLKKVLPFLLPLIINFMIIMLILIVCLSSSGESSVMAGTFFRKPFKEDVHYNVTSYFGLREDPFDNSIIKYHSGIDLSAPDGTEILSIGDGIVVEVGNNPSALGNYVYIKHNYENITYYSVYGHMLNDSIRVIKNQVVKSGDIIGIIGSTGRSTGTHLHLTLMSPIISFDKNYLVDPQFVIEGL